MAVKTDIKTFEEILSALEPRAPMMVLGIEVEVFEPPVYARMVTVTMFDNLTCNELASYEVDPITALLLLARASFCSIDGERQDEFGDFTVHLYDLCQAWFEHRAVRGAVVTRERLTCKLSDVFDFVGAGIAQNGHCDIEINGGLWKVMP